MLWGLQLDQPPTKQKQEFVALLFFFGKVINERSQQSSTLQMFQIINSSD